MNDEIKLKSLGKALQVLGYFSIERPEAGVSEISLHFGMSKSNVYDILRTLEAFHYVEQDPKTKEYRLGYEIIRRGFIYTNTITNSQIIHRYLADAVNELNEIAYFGTVRDYSVLYLGQCLPQNKTRLPSDFDNVAGFTAPLYCTGIGKALLAYQDDAFVETVIRRGLEPHTENTITDPDALRREVRLTRERGYSTDDMEHVYGVRCVGVPILDHNGHAVASISVHGNYMRFTDDRVPAIAKRLKLCAAQIQTAWMSAGF